MITVIDEAVWMVLKTVKLCWPVVACLVVNALVMFVLYWFLIYPCRVLRRLFSGMGFFGAISDIHEEDKLNAD